MAQQWEHATMSVTKRAVEMVSVDGGRTLDGEGGSLRRAMIALDALSAEGWEVVTYSLNRLADDSLFSTFLLRRPKTPGPPQVH